MQNTRIKLSTVLENLLPNFVRDSSPLLIEFLKEYYLSLETKGSTLDVLHNIDNYIKLDNIANQEEKIFLAEQLNSFDTEIDIILDGGFSLPDSNGLIQIDDEIILYRSKKYLGDNRHSLISSVRGFSGITNFQPDSGVDFLEFKSSNAANHLQFTQVKNLSNLIFTEFFTKVKKQFAPGFENRDFTNDLNKNIFIKQLRDFYSSKGTDESFRILFKALYNEKVEVIKPQDFLFIPSNAEYRISRNLVVEKIRGDIPSLVGKTVYQNKSEVSDVAFATVNRVQLIERNGKEYYILSLDYDYDKDINLRGSVFGEFVIGPKTKLTDKFLAGEHSISVDSTVGFPKSFSQLFFVKDGIEYNIDYGYTSNSQFLNLITSPPIDIEPGTEIYYNNFCYGGDQEEIKFRVTGVLSDLEIEDNFGMTKNSSIRIKTLGKIDENNNKANNWIFNLPITYKVKKLSLTGSSNGSYTYLAELFDSNILKSGDIVELLASDSTVYNISLPIDVRTDLSFTFTTNSNLNLSLVYKVRRKIKKFKSLLDSKEFDNSNQYNSDVQNVYYSSTGDEIYVAASSLPNYGDNEFNVKSFLVNLSDESFILKTENLLNSNILDSVLDFGPQNPHPFLTGDEVFYTSTPNQSGLNLRENIPYYVKRISDTEIKLAYTRSNIFTETFIDLEILKDETNSILGSQNIISKFFSRTDGSKVSPKNLLRQIKQPVKSSQSVPTKNGGHTGIFVNGVELLNYKSTDKIFYNKINSISVLNSGSNYDIINPPILQITDKTGQGCQAHLNISGFLDDVQIIKPGFDFSSNKPPVIEISGGNNSKIEVATELEAYEYSVEFNSSEQSGTINLLTGTIGFSTYHKLNTGDEVYYEVPQGSSQITGLQENSIYYVGVINDLTIRLYTNFSDASLKINQIVFSDYGSGKNSLRCVKEKQKIGKVIIPPSTVFSNKRVLVDSVGVNTFSGVINCPDKHGFSQDDRVVYRFNGSSIAGINTTSIYYVNVVDEFSFTISSFRKAPTVSMAGVGTGTHIFQYEPITAKVIGIEKYKDSVEVRPVLKGNIESVYVYNGGEKYGTPDIVNYKRSPNHSILNGEGAQLTPIISNGTITKVIINNPGKNYYSIPKIVVSGGGSQAKLIPILQNNKIVDVVIFSGGIGYEPNKTSLNVISSGIGAVLDFNIQNWTINEVERYLLTSGNTGSSKLTDDNDCFVSSNPVLPSKNLGYFINGLSINHSYAPRKLREKLITRKKQGNSIVYSSDLVKRSGEEIESSIHSPIIGWAYDGNPIYGPYGFEKKDGSGMIKRMISGYQLVQPTNRPDFPPGFFVEDYQYFGSDQTQANSEIVLDQHNGRFCVTPEYPDGVYAYFCTIGNMSREFDNYKLPVFPYVIGNTYYSVPNDYNINPDNNNQESIDINKQGFIRNTKPYNLNKENSEYEFLNTDTNKGIISKIISLQSGGIDGIDIPNRGEKYRVGEALIFNSSNTGGKNASAFVSEVECEEILGISVDNNLNYSNIDFSIIPDKDSLGFIGFTTVPNRLDDSSPVPVILSGIKKFITNETRDFISKNVSVTKNTLILLNDVDSIENSGSIAYLTVSGNLNYPTIKENDVYKLSEFEKVKVLNVDKKLSRIRVLRNFGGSTNPNILKEKYLSGSILFEEPKKFKFISPVNVNQNYEISRQYYFDPDESLGIGTVYGEENGKNIVFSNPGTGSTQVFVQTQQIYLPNHSIKDKSKIVYSSEGFSPISISTDGIISQTIQEKSVFYATVFSSDFIGISTVPVGISTINSRYVGADNSSGLLYFTNVGNGKYHSFTTLVNSENNGKLSTSLATISVKVKENETNQFELGDQVRLEVLSGITTSYKVLFNLKNRRIVFDPKSYISSSVDIEKNTIKIIDHRYYTGQKVIYNSQSSSTLINDKIYYVVVIDKDTISLSNSYQNAIINNPIIVDINSAVNGSISVINPKIEITRNQEVKFDLSDSSLSFVKGNQLYSAFKLNFYRDKNFSDLLENSVNFKKLNIIRSGSVGITSTATLTIKINENWPDSLYYKFDFENLNFISSDKKELIVDTEVLDYNQISIIPSVFTAEQTVVGVGSTSFNISIDRLPEFYNYNKNNSSIKLFAKTVNKKGKISKINIFEGGVGYKSLPSIESIDPIDENDPGFGGILFATSKTVGKVKTFEIKNIGSDYYCDYSLRPTAKLPENLRLEPFNSIGTIKVTYPGINYSVSPKLILFDGLTDVLDKNIILEYELGDSFVSVVKNSNGLFNKTPRIVPINNTNGISIRDISFDSSNKEVTVFLGVGFSLNSQPFPFKVGDKVLIENTSVGIGTADSNGDFQFVKTGTGYNSSDYNYKLFTLSDIDENYGGFGSVKFKIDEFISGGQTPGKFNRNLSQTATIIPEKYLPRFDISLVKNEFLTGESVKSESSAGLVENWNSNTDTLTVSTIDQFKIGEVVRGETTSSTAKIVKVDTFNAIYTVAGSSVVKEGWQDESGFLNNSEQRTPDNDYYQYFSYSLKSKKQFSEWEEPVSRLNHIAGFKKFSNLIVESAINISDLNQPVGLATSAISVVSFVTDFIENVDFNCYNYFDIVSENAYYLGDSLVSDEITLDNIEIQDYIESIGNRVLLIDDISPLFDNSPRPTPYSIVDTFNFFDDNIGYRKYFAYIKDKTFNLDRQFSIITLLPGKTNSFINQYATVDSSYILGSFDSSNSGPEINLEFYPVNFQVNDYDVYLLSFSIVEDLSDPLVGNLSGISTIQTNTETIQPGIGNTTISLIGISSEHRTSKLLVSLKNDDYSYTEFTELTVLKDESGNYSILEYGHLSNDSNSILGIGSYNSYYDNTSNKTIIEVQGNVSFASTSKLTTMAISLDSVGTASSESVLNNSKVFTSYEKIISSPSPGITTISTYSGYKGSYHIVSVADTVGNRYQTSEINLLTAGSDCFITEFGIIETSDNLCSFGANVIGQNINLEITPIENTTLEVRVFSVALKENNPLIQKNKINIGSSYIKTTNSEYFGTEREVRKEFDIYHKNIPVFEKKFNAELPTIVDTIENKFVINSHYFTTGEEIVYDPNGGISIGIGTTSISGIGVTNKLPSKLYVVKIDEISFQVASTIEDALLPTPNLLKIQSVGIGTAHKFTATKQINKAILAIDNVVQTPILVSTALTTVLSSNVEIKDVRITVDDVTNFSSGDHIKIDDEILKITRVGFGGTNILLTERKTLGTGISTHFAGAIVKKTSGNYNIVNNKIFFIDPPYGKIPESNPNNELDDVDWTGITTSSSFHGRVFLRSAAPNVISETYSKNYIFDNISEQFDGIKSTFDLKNNQQNVSGLSTSNVIVMLKDIVQIPQKTDAFDPNGNYRVVGSGQTTSLVFTKSGTEQNPYDINITNVPAGGVVVSVSSKGGFGYQTLVSAGATAVVSTSGTIQSLVVGNFGSGYRKASSYQIISQVSQNIGIGQSEIFVDNVESLLQKLNYSLLSFISIGNVIKDAPIVGYTTDRVIIGSGSTITSLIEQSTTVLVKLSNPKSSIINVGVSTDDSETIYHIGFTTSNGGYISSNITITNPGISYTNFPTKYETQTSSIVSIGSTVIPISVIHDVKVGDYIEIQTFLPKTKIVGIGETFVNISTASTISSSIPANQFTQIKKNDPPKIIFEQPLSYSNIPLIYSPNSPNGVGLGTNCYANVVVGEDRILDFEIINSGYGYKKGDVLTVSLNDTALGISSDLSKQFERFELIVDQIYNDKFAAWSIGDIDILDSFDDLFDGQTKTLPLRINGSPISIRAKKGSIIDIQSTLLIVINDVIQIPEISYKFDGGSTITFTEAPNLGDKSYVLFYKGTSEVDVRDVDILETIKVGDDVYLRDDNPNLNQSKRVVSSIVASDRFFTNLYNRIGINSTEKRSLTWCKQTEDKVINGKKTLKDRESYEPSIYQETKLIQNVSIGSSEIFVDSIKNLFNSPKENTALSYQNKIKIVSNEPLVSAAATCNVSISGTITSFNIQQSGSGYGQSPEITIQNPIGVALTLRATATSSITNGKLSAINLQNSGSGYNLGPIASIKLISSGSGFPSGLNPVKQNNVFYGAKLKSLSGNGSGATANIFVDKNNIVYSIELLDRGNGYSIGDSLYVDTFDNVKLNDMNRNTVLSSNIVFSVESINPPAVLISPPNSKFEVISNVQYEGDYGDVVGMGTTGSLFYVDLFVPYTSPLRTTGSGTTLTGIQTNYYFVVNNSNLGDGSTSLRNDNSLIGIGTTCFDNIYQVFELSVFESNVPGVGVTYITRVKTKVQDLSKVEFPLIQSFDSTSFTFDSTVNTFDNLGLQTRKYGEYSWGRITMSDRKNPKSFDAYTYNGIIGLSTNPSIQRYNPLRYKNYIQ